MLSLQLQHALRGRRILAHSRLCRRAVSTAAQPNTRYVQVTHPEANLPPEVQTSLNSLSKFLLPVYARPPIILERAQGMYAWDTQGRRYLDFSGGIAVNSLGHSDQALADIMHEQATTLLHTSNVFHNKWAGVLAEKLVYLTQEHGGLGLEPGSEFAAPPKVFFSNSGTEANEGALKIGRRVGKDRWAMQRHGRMWDHTIPFDRTECAKVGIVCFRNGFHGRSMGALSVTSNPKYQQPFSPLIPGVRVGELNAKPSLELIDEDTCAVIVETIQGEGGVMPAETEWLRNLRQKCDEVGAVLIYDEIQCGLFRTGTLWAHSELPSDCHPDIITSAKPLGNGYPMGAVIMRNEIAESMKPGSHGTTFGGSALACRLGSHVVGRLSEGSFLSEMRKSASQLDERLKRLAEFFPEMIGAARGRGLIRGVPFLRDPSVNPGRIVQMARERGVLLLTGGADAVRCVPSLSVRGEEIDHAMDVIESCLGLL